MSTNVSKMMNYLVGRLTQVLHGRSVCLHGGGRTHATDQLEEKPPDTVNSSKRARGEDYSEVSSLRKHVEDSFKAKLLSMASPNSWQGFGKPRERLKIGNDDCKNAEGRKRKEMTLSIELKTQLN
ncbi:hypothetical protein ACOSP7_028080 [Xanthoceras sorbifolium]